MLLDIQQNLINLLILGSLGYSLYILLTKKLGLTVPLYLVPALGLASIGCMATAFWFLNIAMMYSYIVICSITGALFLALLFIFGRSFWAPLLTHKGNIICITFITVLLIIQSAAVPFSAKISQGFPWDRFTYMGAAIGFTQNNLQYYEDAVRTLEADGSNKQLWFDHITTPMVTNEMHKRPTVDLLIGVLNFNAKNKLHYLGQSYETLLRICQFFSFLYLCSLLIKNRYLAILVTGTFAFGYWFQYLKDFNAWGFEFATIFAIASLATLVDLLKNPDKPLGRALALSLFIATACIGYPESGFILGSILLTSLGITYLFFKPNRKLIRYLALSVLIGIALSFLLYPHILWYLKWLASRLSDTDFSECERYVRSILNPYIWEQPDRWKFLNELAIPRLRHIASLFPSLLFGVIGIHFVMKAPLYIIYPLFIVVAGIIFYSLYKIKVVLNKPSNIFILLYCSLWLLEILSYLALKQPFPALRSISYIFPLISFLITILLVSSKAQVIRYVGFTLILYHILYGALVFQSQRKVNYHNFDNGGYALSHDGVRIEPFNNKGKLNDIYSFNYKNLEAEITKKCNFIFLDLNNYWHQTAIVFMLESNQIRYETALPYRDFVFGGGIKAPGKSLEKFNGNCVISEEMIDGKIDYKLKLIQR